MMYGSKSYLATAIMAAYQLLVLWCNGASKRAGRYGSVSVARVSAHQLLLLVRSSVRTGVHRARIIAPTERSEFTGFICNAILWLVNTLDEILCSLKFLPATYLGSAKAHVREPVGYEYWIRSMSESITENMTAAPRHTSERRQDHTHW